MSEELTRAGEPLFAIGRRGYDPDEVDGYVSQLHQQIRTLQDENLDLRQVQTPDEAVSQALDKVGREVTDILKQAHESARDIVATAEREGADIKQSAERHAAHVIAVAEKRLHELDLDTDRVWAERERIVSDVSDLARQLGGVAELAAERFPNSPPASEGAAAAHLRQ